MSTGSTGYAKYSGTIALEKNEHGIFVTLDGVKVAKRDADKWTPLRRGYTVNDLEGGTAFELKLNGSKVYQR